MPFLRRRSAAATPGTSPAPVAAPAPVAPPISRPVSPAPAPVVSAPGTPNLSDAITQLKGGNRQSAEAMMRQIVGLPPLPAAPPMPTGGTPNLSDAINQLKGGNRQGGEELMRQIVGLPPLPAQGQPPGDGIAIGREAVYEPQPAIPPPEGRAIGKPWVYEPQPNIEKPITTMPVPGPGVAAPYPQAPFGNPAKSQMGMQAYLDQQNRLAQRMNQQRNPMAGPNPYMQQAPLAGPNPYMQQAPAIPLGMQVQQPGYMQSPEFQGYMTQAQDLQRQMEAYMQKAPMYQQMQDLQGKMQQYQQQNMNQFQPYMPQRMTMDMPQAQQPMPEFPPQPMDDGTIMGRAANMMSRAGVFGNPQPMQTQPPFGMQQQPMGPQSPMERLYDAPSSPMGQPLIGSPSGQQLGQPPMQQQPMGQFQQNNAQQMSNFQNQNQNQGNQNPGNQNQNRGGMFGRGFGGGGNSGDGGGGGLF